MDRVIREWQRIVSTGGTASSYTTLPSSPPNSGTLIATSRNRLRLRSILTVWKWRLASVWASHKNLSSLPWKIVGSSHHMTHLGSPRGHTGSLPTHRYIFSQTSQITPFQGHSLFLSSIGSLGGHVKAKWFHSVPRRTNGIWGSLLNLCAASWVNQKFPSADYSAWHMLSRWYFARLIRPRRLRRSVPLKRRWLSTDITTLHPRW
jgi:hypothetical protein